MELNFQNNQVIKHLRKTYLLFLNVIQPEESVHTKYTGLKSKLFNARIYNLYLCK